MNRADSPAWGLYDLWRTAKLNEKYYAARSDFLQKINICMDITIAVTAPGGTISAITLWSTPVGAILWKVLLVIAAVVGILKPLLHLTDSIKKMETCLSGYRLLVHDTNEIINDMKQRRRYDDEIVKEYKEAYKRKGVLISQNPETKESKRLVSRFTEEVNRELADYDFYIPEESNV